MSERLPVYIYAEDPISEAGIATQLRLRADLRLVGPAEIDRAAVAVVVADEVGPATVRVVRAIQRNGCPRVVVVVGRLDDRAMLAATEAGACGLLRRADATADSLADAAQSAAAGDGMLPADLLGRLLDQVGQLQRQVLAPQRLTFGGLHEREVEVLRLVADGCDTSEIATRLCYSERTIKNVIHDVTMRLQLKNRCHAVAYAMREGLI